MRNAADFLGDDFLVISGDALTDIDLAAMRTFHESHDGIATLATKRVEDTTQFGVAITDAEGRIGGFQEKPQPSEALSDLANCGIYMFRKEIFDFFPAPGTSKAAKPGDPEGFADWAMDVFPRLLEGDVPFYSHEIDAYWNDVGNLDELRESTYDALSGAVQVEQVGEVVDGFRSGTAAEDEPDLEGPVLLGPGCEIGDDVRIDGPSVIGDGAKVGAGQPDQRRRSSSRAPRSRSAASSSAPSSAPALAWRAPAVAPSVRTGASRRFDFLRTTRAHFLAWVGAWT